jgi:fucose permease
VSETLTGTSAYIVALTLSAGIFGLAASVLAHYQTRISVLHPATCLAWILVFIGTALLTQIARFSTFGILVGVLIVLGVGAGMLCGYLAASSTPALMSRSTQETRDEGRIPQIITSYAVFLSLGRTIGIAIGASIFQNSLYKQLLHNPATNGSAHSWTNDAVALIQVVRGMSVQQRSDMVPAYVAAVKPIWIFAAVLAGVGLLASSGAYWVGRERQRVEGERRIRTEAV